MIDNGLLIGVGVGPGDPELLTLKAVRALESADVVAHFAKAGNPSNARATAEKYLRPAACELQLLYPVTTEHPTAEAAYRCAIDQFFDESAALIAEHLQAGKVVAVLSEGDPLFFGSYMHIHIRLMNRFRTEVIPGVTAMSGCWSAAGLPIVQGDDVLTVLPGTLGQEELVRRLRQNEPTVVMKLESPGQRGSTCMWICAATPAPALSRPYRARRSRYRWFRHVRIATCRAPSRPHEAVP